MKALEKDFEKETNMFGEYYFRRCHRKRCLFNNNGKCMTTTCVPVERE